MFSPKPKLILFDVYTTLLDMSEIERHVNRLMNSKRGYDLWLGLFMEYCFVDNCIEQFNDFNSIAAATMLMAAEMFDRDISNAEIEMVLERFKHLPLHEGVSEGLSILNDQQYSIAALTNSGQQTVVERMERTGLISYFQKILSAEHVRKYKPSIEVYNWAAREMHVRSEEVLMVTAHGWDVAGASNAGMKTAYIKSKEVLFSLSPKPDITVANLPELATILANTQIASV